MIAIRRRTLLQGLAALAAGGVLGVRRTARATPPPLARRIVFYVSGHGTVHDRWEMPGSGSLDTAIDRSLSGLAEDQFSHILQPLWSFRDKLLVVDGLANYAGMSAAFNEHEEGSASCMSGFVPVPVSGALGVSPGPSIDQVIAAQRTTPIRSLEYGIGGWPVCFDDAGQPIPYEGDIWAAYQRLFPAGADPDGQPTTADRVRAYQSTVLALAEGRFDRLAPQLTGDDRAKLEQHRDLLHDLSGQLAGLAELECDVPPEPGGFPSWEDPTWAEEMTRAFQSLAHAATACGITDVVTIRQDVMQNATIGAPPGDLHTDFAHNVAIDPNAADVMAEYHRWHAERFADLCAMFDAVPEEDGTMLDHTLLVWSNELATGDHSMTRCPVVIAGGTKALQTGRYVNFPPERDFAGPWGTIEATGPAHNRLMVVLARALGQEIDAVGEATFTDYDGVAFDATGPLDGLLVGG
ncbi:MAG: DUF1552 domain-containing protein [Myxococcota bacterium]